MINYYHKLTIGLWWLIILSAAQHTWADSLPSLSRTEGLRRAGSPDTLSPRTFFERGIFRLNNDMPKEAIEDFIQAYTGGINRDSVSYYISEALIIRAVFDTAIAFNLAISESLNPVFQEKVIQQRERIYLSLGLTKEGTKRPVPVKTKSKKVSTSWIPKTYLAFNTGYFKQTAFSPDDLLGLEDVNSDEGPDNSLRLKTEWKLSSYHNAKLMSGLILKGSKEYYKDYIDLDYGGFLEIKNILFDNLSIDFTYINDLKADDIRVHANSISLTHMKFTRKSLLFGILGYNFDITDEELYRSDKFWSMFYWDRSIGTGSGPGLSLILYYKKVQELNEQAIARFIYADDIALPAEPNIYTDSSYTQLVTYKYQGLGRPEDARLSLSDTLSRYSEYLLLNLFLPQNHISSDLNFTWSQNLFKKITLGMSAGGSFRYFLKNYVWYPNSGSWGGTDDFPWLVFNRTDGNFYGVDSRMPADGGPFGKDITGTGYEEINKKRIDHSVKFQVFGRQIINPIGHMGLEIRLERNWSTLSEIAPLDIPKWDYGVSLSWRKTLF